MKAIVCRAFGPPEQLDYADVPEPTPSAGQVVIAIRASGVNFPDTLIVQGAYQMKPPFPFTPGTDVAGVVRSVGEGVQHVRPGDRVLGFTPVGGFAEQVACDARAVVPIPEGVSFETAAAFPMVYSTSYHALVDRAKLQRGETLLVLGAAGGVGLAAIEIGKALGARVIAAASTPEKLAVCRDAGADEGIDYTSENLRERLRELTGGNGVDVVYDPVGGPYTEPALRSTAWGGRYLVIGFTAGEIPRIPLNLPLLKGCSIVGVFWGAFTEREPAHNAANTRQLLAWLADGTIRPRVSRTYPLASAADALNDLIARRVTGKVVLVQESET